MHCSSAGLDVIFQASANADVNAGISNLTFADAAKNLSGHCITYPIQ